MELLAFIVPRLLLALFAGVVLGLNRWLHHKSAGIRTHSLVAIGAATAILLVADFPQDNAQSASRVLQGLLTGIGFLGAGVIVQSGSTNRTHGLTTAASLWAVALFGAAFGAGQFTLGLTALSLTILIIVLGGFIEKQLAHRFTHQAETELKSDDLRK
ncbi:MgtC/SapB family protein [Polynucleobacter meluiroseus]|nr:MgtC/SapB family protein [Polynucleobacter meluiroseus]